MALTEFIGMYGHPLKFEARLDWWETPEFEGLADAQDQGQGDLVFPVGPPVPQHDLDTSNGMDFRKRFLLRYNDCPLHSNKFGCRPKKGADAVTMLCSPKMWTGF